MSQSESPFERSIANPYPGLRPFQPHEAAIFFGRDEHVAEMLTVLEDHRFLAVVGPSGGGKSSLVLAGLLPALRRGELLTDRSGNWRFVSLRPGDSPFRNLAEAVQQGLASDAGTEEPPWFHDGDARLTEIVLRGGERGFTKTLRDAAVPSTTNVLLLVDQFEELFRFRGPERVESDEAAARRRNEAADFVKLLLATARQTDRPVYVMLTMRSDFLGDCDVFEGLPQAINAGQYLTPRLNLRQLEQAISGPPALPRFGGSVDPAVVQRIANDVGSQRDELPVVQHALALAWRHAVERSRKESDLGPAASLRLKLADYLAVGGIREALSRDADEALQACREQGLERTTELVFRASVQRGPNGQYVRRPRTMGQLAAESGESFERVRTVVEQFYRDRSFLIPSPREVENWSPETRVDISHESLIRQWGTLRNRWLAAEQEAESRFRRLADAERKYRHGDGDLLAEIEMKRLDEWWKRAQPNRAWAKRYLTPYVGPGAEDVFDVVEKYLTASRQAHEDRVAEEKRRVDEEKARQIRELEEAEKRLRMIRGWLAGVVTLALVAVGVGYYANEKRAEAERFERSAQKATREAYRNLAGAHWAQAFQARDERHESIAASWHFLLAAEASGKAGLRVRQAGERIAAQGAMDLAATFVHSNLERGVGFHLGKTRLLTRSYDGVVRFWDAVTGQIVRTWHHPDVHGASVADDESHVLTWGADGDARLWSASSQSPLHVWNHGKSVRGGLFSTSSQQALTWSDDGTIRLWHVSHDRALRSWKLDSPVSEARFNPDGSLVLATTNDSATLWDTTSDIPLRTWRVGASKKMGAEFVHGDFNRDGSRMLIWASDGIVRLLDPRRDTPLRTWNHDSFVWWAVFNRDESRITSFADGGTVKVLSESQDEPIRTIECGKSSFILEVSEDATRVLVRQHDTLELWDAAQGRVIRTWSHGSARDAVFNHNFSRVVSWGFDGTVRLWTVDSDTPLQLWQHDREVSGAVFSDDDSQVLTWSQDGTAKLWTERVGSPLRSWRHAESGGRIEFATLLSASARIFTWSDDGVARLWSLDSDPPSYVWKHKSRVANPSFTRDGSRVLTASWDKTACLWSVAADSPLKTWEHDDVVVGAAFAKSDTRVITWSLDGTVCLRATNTPELIRRWAHDRPNKGIVGTRLSPDDTRILTWGYDGRMQLWHVDQDQPLRRWRDVGDIVDAMFIWGGKRFLTWDRTGAIRMWSESGEKWEREWAIPRGMNADVVGVLPFRDETKILAWHRNGIVNVWSLESDSPRQTWRLYGEVRGVRLLEDDSKVWAWGGGSVILAAVRDGRVVFEWQHSGMRDAMLSDRQTDFVTCAHDGSMKLWSTAQAKPIQTWTHSGVRFAWFTRDVKRILTWGNDGTARLWSPTQVSPLRIWKYGESVDYEDGGLMVSKDESRVLAWRSDGIVRLFDFEHDEPLRVVPTNPELNGAMLSPDDSKIVTWAQDGKIRVWELLDDRQRSSGDMRLEWEVRSATTLDHAGRVIRLTFDEWQDKRRKLDTIRSRNSASSVAPSR